MYIILNMLVSHMYIHICCTVCSQLPGKVISARCVLLVNQLLYNLVMNNLMILKYYLTTVWLKNNNIVYAKKIICFIKHYLYTLYFNQTQLATMLQYVLVAITLMVQLTGISFLSTSVMEYQITVPAQLHERQWKLCIIMHVQLY